MLIDAEGEKIGGKRPLGELPVTEVSLIAEFKTQMTNNAVSKTKYKDMQRSVNLFSLFILVSL